MKSIFKFVTRVDSFLILLFLFSILGVVIPIFIGQQGLAILGTYLAIPMILSAIVFFFVQQKINSKLKIFSRRSFVVLNTTYAILISSSIILLYTNSVRPATYFLIISICYTIVLMEILHFEISRSKSVLYLIQIGLLVLNISWGVTLNYHLFIGRTDLIIHQWWIANLVNDGFITDIFSNYTAFPLYHILIAISHYFTSSIAIYELMFFINGILYFSAIFFTYLIAKKISENEKLALLSSLFVSVNPQFIWYSLSAISRSAVNVLLLVLILLLIYKNRSRFSLLTMIVSVSLIIYHHASMPFIVMILLLILVINYYYRYFEKVSVSVMPFYEIFLIFLFSISYWIYSETIIVRQVMGNLFSEISDSPMNDILFTNSPITEVFNYFQYSPLLFFVLLGALFVIKEKKEKYILTIFCLTGLFLTALALPGPLELLDKLARDLQIGRIGEYAFLFTSIAAAMGMLILYQKTKRFGQVLIMLLFASMCLLAIANDFNASDNPFVKRPFYTFYLTEDETRGIDYLSNVTSGYVLGDYVSGRYTSASIYAQKSGILEVDRNETKFLTNSSKDILLIRHGELTRRPLQIVTSSSGKFISSELVKDTLHYVYNNSPVWSTTKYYCKIFETENVAAYN